MTATNDTQDEKEFIDWMENLGFELHPNLGFKNYGGSASRGVYAARGPISTGSVLFRQPDESLLHPSSPHCIVSDILAGKLAKSDPFAALITPLFWSSAELEELKGTEVMEQLGRDEIEATYHQRIEPLVKANPIVFTTEDCSMGGTLEDFLECGSIVMSRAFDAGPKGVPAMTPMADMLNHRTGLCNAHLISDDVAGHAPSFVAINDIPKGGELINTYGDHSNAELLRRYGFTEENNPYDTVDLSAELLDDGSGDALKRLRRINAPISFTLKASGRVPLSLLRAAKLCAIPAEEYKAIRPGQIASHLGEISSDTIGSAAWAVVSRAVAKRLMQYATQTNDDDEELLKHPDNLPINRLNAIRVRFGEKKILIKLLKHARKYTQ